MHLSDLRDPKVSCVLLGPAYLPFIKTELTLSDMQKPLFCFIQSGCDAAGPTAAPHSPLLPRQHDGCTRFHCPFSGCCLSVKFILVKEENTTSETNAKNWLWNLETGWWAKQRAGNSSTLAVCLGFLKSDLHLTAPLSLVTLDYRPLGKVVTAPIFSSNSLSAK